MASQVYRSMRLVDMQNGCNDARSSAWWNNLIRYGAWNGPGTTRVSPPPPEAINGIADLFGVTPEEVNRMIAADWYDVQPAPEFSPRVRRWAPLIDRLNTDDANYLRRLLRRLATGEYTMPGVTKATVRRKPA